MAIITGAGGGLGRSYARLLASEGAAIVVNDMNADAAQVVAEITAAAGGRAVTDVSASGLRRGDPDAALEAFGGVDILVNNAGILRDKSFANLSEENWDAVIKVHLKGTFCVTQPVFRWMKETSAPA